MNSYLLFGMAITLGFSTMASAATTRVDLSKIEVTPHELALTQVLAEICPPFLTHEQKQKFSTVYQFHLQDIMPTLDTKIAMAQVNAQPEYRTILQDIRQWTNSFPTDENKALCVEFAESSIEGN